MKDMKELYLPGAIVLASLILGVSLVASGGITISTGGSTAGTVAPDTNVNNNGSTVEFTITEDDHIRGNPEAAITLVEFSDLECPFCQRFHPTVKQALAEYDNNIRWVYKHFPLDAIHPEARPAAEASECVWEQKGEEAFWTFTDEVFDKQDRIGSSLYREIAESLGVNLAQFDDCVSSRKYRDKVEQDYQEGLQAGVTGTPGSFLNGIPVRGAIPYGQLKSIIDSQLQ